MYAIPHHRQESLPEGIITRVPDCEVFHFVVGIFTEKRQLTAGGRQHHTGGEETHFRFISDPFRKRRIGYKIVSKGQVF